MKKLYVAFSVAGSNTFLVAEKTVKDSEYKDLKANPDFAVVPSRDPAATVKSYGIKLHWKRLQNKEGKPLHSAPMIMSRFKELVEMYGFSIVETTRASFVKKHWAKK